MTAKGCNFCIGLLIALAVAFIIAVTFARFGCASAPVVDKPVGWTGAFTGDVPGDVTGNITGGDQKTLINVR